MFSTQKNFREDTQSELYVYGMPEEFPDHFTVILFISSLSSKDGLRNNFLKNLRGSRMRG